MEKLITENGGSNECKSRVLFVSPLFMAVDWMCKHMFILFGVGVWMWLNIEKKN